MRSGWHVPLDELEESEPGIFGPTDDSEATPEEQIAALTDKISALYSIDGDWDISLENPDEVLTVSISRFGGKIEVDGRRTNPDPVAMRGNLTPRFAWNMLKAMDEAVQFAQAEGNSYHREWEEAPPPHELAELAWSVWRQFRDADELPAMKFWLSQPQVLVEGSEVPLETRDPNKLLWKILTAIGIGIAFWRLDLGIAVCGCLGFIRALTWSSKPPPFTPETTMATRVAAFVFPSVGCLLASIGAITVVLWLKRVLGIPAIETIFLPTITFYATVFLVGWVKVLLLPMLTFKQRGANG